MDTKRESFREKAVIMTGNAASCAALGILKENREELEKRYPIRYLRDALGTLESELKTSFPEEAEDRFVSVSCSRGGVFEALWKLGEALDCVLTFGLSEIPVLQCTIEFCDYMDINPYEADSTGCMVIATAEPGKTLEYIRGKGFKAEIIGYTTPVKARIIKGSTVRYLTKT